MDTHTERSYWSFAAKSAMAAFLLGIALYLAYLGALFVRSEHWSVRAAVGAIIAATLVTFLFIALELFSVLSVMGRRRREAVRPAEPEASSTPFVSVHIPTFTEPPDVVKATLDSLSRLEYPRFEVLVIDNNTAIEDLWRPVEAYCARLGPRFRFFHVDNLPGAKAGALNYALGKTSREADIIAVVDSDYQVEPDFLSRLVPFFGDPAVAIVQTPQDYRGFAKGGYLERPFWEYRYFFSIVMSSCNEYNAASFTGTMGLVRKKVLTDVKKWSEWCITEDTEVGLRMHQNNLSALYLDRSFGRGLMPFEFRDWRKQRWRWTFGNMQIIRRNFLNLLPLIPSRGLSRLQKIAYLSQLTVWFNNLFASSLIVIGLGALALAGIRFPAPVLLGAGMLLAAPLVSKAVIFLWALRRRERLTVKQSFGALFAHLAQTWPMATGWLACLLDSSGAFWRTAKYPHALRFRDRIRTVQWELLLFLTSCALAAFLFARGEAVLAALLLAQAAIFYLPPLIAVERYQ